MIKRPLDKRFGAAVLAEEKFTTIREKAWPVGMPIMLYHWSGLPYRSKQTNVSAVKVLGFWPIEIHHDSDGQMKYMCGMENGKALWQSEGFGSQTEMDDWFRKVTKPGRTMKMLMRFKLLAD